MADNGKENLLNHKPLACSRGFWLSLGGPLLSGGICFLLIVNGDNLWWRFCFSSACFNDFVEIFKVPLAIAGLSIPLVAMFATLYRSKETSIQIGQSARQYSEAVSNNIFGNYIKHKESFVKYMQGRERDLIVDGTRFVVNAPALYERVFELNSYDNLEIKSDAGFSFWIILSLQYENLVGLLLGEDTRESFESEYAARLLIAFKEVQGSLCCNVEEGLVVRPNDLHSRIEFLSVKKGPALYSLLATHEVFIRIIRAVQLFSSVDLNIEESMNRVEEASFLEALALFDRCFVCRWPISKE